MNLYIKLYFFFLISVSTIQILIYLTFSNTVKTTDLNFELNLVEICQPSITTSRPRFRGQG